MAHTCHALGCNRSCPPQHLMCRQCWTLVPADLQNEVRRTAPLRNSGFVDATWAPWWRAQAAAIAHVANLKEPNEAAKQTFLARAEDFAKRIESRVKKIVVEPVAMGMYRDPVDAAKPYWLEIRRDDGTTEVRSITKAQAEEVATQLGLLDDKGDITVTAEKVAGQS